jgi:hypothetical protein
MATKTCSKCGVLRDVVAFSRDSSKPDGLYSSCSECRATYARSAPVRERRRAQYAADPAPVISAVVRARDVRRRQDPEYRKREAAYERERRRRPDVKSRLKDSDLRRQYGMSSADLDRMLATQGGRCAVCREAFGHTRLNRPNVDHDHVTGRVRGLLCLKCNTGIGHLGDSVSSVAKAAAYLGAHEHQDGIGAGLVFWMGGQ